MEARASSTAHKSPSAAPASRARGLLGLPREVQAEIIRHCSTRDLVCVALVSKYFRDLAAAQLYREFRIVFPDEDNLQFDTPVDFLAGRFDTFVTSDYNYAQYLRLLDFDTLHMGDKAVVTYRPYLANLSCGKFMNTLLLLTLRKARALETFKWNIRVELSRPVYRELHRIPALSHLHIRLQAGPSQYEAPPPLPYAAPNSSSSPPPAHAAPIPNLAPPQPMFALTAVPPPPPPPAAFYVPPTTTPPPPPPKPSRARAAKKASPGNEPPTLSGFSKLKSLAVLDIDSLDLVPELQACVRNSAGTLADLKLSFSANLASSARKPQVDPETEDSDQEDELMPIPAQSHSQTDELSAPARAFRAQEERKTQESVLARIFGVEPAPAEKPQPVVVATDKKTGKARSEQELVEFIKTIAPRFLAELNGTTGVAASQDVLDMMGEAAKKYVEEARARKEERQGDGADPAPAEPSASAEGRPPPEDEAGGAADDQNGPAVSLFGEESAKKARDGKGDVEPEDIDIEEPEDELSIDPGDPPSSDATAGEPEAPAEAPAEDSAEGEVPATLGSREQDCGALAAELEAFGSQVKSLARDLERRRDSQAPVDLGGLADAEAQLVSLTRRIRDMQKDVGACPMATESAETRPPDPDHVHHMRDYVRETRGAALQSLGIYLIPVKASVLSRAVDLRVLRRLTLLNVGVQAPVWALLHRENREAPLPLRHIFTDNVSLVFLKFASSLPEVHELFLLEREAKAKPESFAPRTQTTMDQIRRLVLKKHAPTLRRLMVKNMADTTWDLNDKAILLLCRQGRRLEELACSMGIRAMHCLMQHIEGLASLFALHVVHLRNDDTCVWVMRETKRFLVDTVAHFPELKLSWIAIDEDDRADRLFRVDGFLSGDGKDGQGEKGKEKAGDDDDDDGGGDDDENNNNNSSSSKKNKGKGTLESLLASASSAEDVDVSALIAAELGEGADAEGNSGVGGGVDMGSGGDDGEETESEDEGDGDGGYFWQRIETVEGISFDEIDGVTIFEKEVVAGQL